MSSFESKACSSAHDCLEQVNFPIAVLRQPLHTPVLSQSSLCTRLQRFSVARLVAMNSDEANRPSLGSKSKVLIRRVRQFFEEIKKILGDSCKGTILHSTVELTAWACGVTPDTVTRIGTRPEFVHEQLPRAKKKMLHSHKDYIKTVTFNRHGGRWGDIIRDFIANRLPKDRMTTPLLHAELRRSYDDFRLSMTTLKYLLYGMGVKFVRNRGKQTMVFET